MPYVTNSGARVFYRLQLQNDPRNSQRDVPLLLLHGFMQRSEDWKDAGNVDQLAEHRRLILVDARGHGLSDKPHDISDYGMELLVSDIVAVLASLKESQIDFMGYSFGAWVGFGMAALAPKLLRSLVLGGMHPYVRVPGPLNRRIDRFTKTRDGLAAGGRHADLIPEQVKAQFQENDIQALISLTTAIRDSAGFDAALDALEVPGLIYAGGDDPAYPLSQRCVEGRHNLEFLSLPGLGHMEAWHRGEFVLPHVNRFLDQLD